MSRVVCEHLVMRSSLFPALAASAATIAIVLVLSGCSTRDLSGVEAFDRAQTDEDVLSAEITDGVGVDPDSSRYLASDDEVDYFVAKTEPIGSVCLVSIPASGEWTGTCGASLPLTLRRVGGSEIQLTGVTELPEANGWRFISPNLAVR